MILSEVKLGVICFLCCFSPALVVDDPLSGYKPFECGKQRPIECYYPAVCAYRGEPNEQCLGKIGDCSPERCWEGEYECVEGQFCFEKGKSSTTPVPPKRVQNCGLPMIDDAADADLRSSQAVRADGTEERILNGTPTQPAKWPWSVSLASKINDTHYASYCGGSIVAERYVLTAAHCVCDSFVKEGCLKTRSPEKFHVFSNVSTHMGKYSPMRPEWIERRVERVYVDPSAVCQQEKPSSCGNDIALLKLTEPYVFGRLAQPVCLTNSVVDEEGKEVTITGYSTDKDSDNERLRYGVLREAETELIHYANCERNITFYLANSSLLNRRDNICTLGLTPPNKDSCSVITANGTCRKYGQAYYGDSGSPMQIRRKGRWMQLGVASWAPWEFLDSHIAKKGTVLPDVFARVSSSCKWMKEVSDGEVQCLPMAG